METLKQEKNGVVMFSEEELKDISGVEIYADHIEVICGCTSRRYGDAVGKLRVYRNGELLIKCECNPGCGEDNMTPAAFEKHAEREGAKKWKYYVWVMIDGDKVPIFKSPLLKYYEMSLDGKWSHRSLNVHHDEFIQCTKCRKLRRFRLKTKEDCRNHHDARLKRKWTCADYNYEEVTCDDDEERSTRRVLRGCPRQATCRGCTMCVCFGCNLCRYEDCNCQACVDFTKNKQA